MINCCHDCYMIVMRGSMGCPPLVHSLWEIDRIRWLTTPVPNKLIVIKLEISSKYLIQYILGENPGNPTMLID